MANALRGGNINIEINDGNINIEINDGNINIEINDGKPVSLQTARKCVEILTKFFDENPDKSMWVTRTSGTGGDYCTKDTFWIGDKDGNRI